MSRVGLLLHYAKPEAKELGTKIAHWLRDQGHEPCMSVTDVDQVGAVATAIDREAFSGIDLLVVLGGDGTMLHGIELAGFAGVPILGVNLGYLGFLTEVGPDDIFDALDATLEGRCTLDERSTVEAKIIRPDGVVEDLGQAINEFSVER